MVLGSFLEYSLGNTSKFVGWLSNIDVQNSIVWNLFLLVSAPILASIFTYLIIDRVRRYDQFSVLKGELLNAAMHFSRTVFCYHESNNNADFLLSTINEATKRETTEAVIQLLASEARNNPDLRLEMSRTVAKIQTEKSNLKPYISEDDKLLLDRYVSPLKELTELEVTKISIGAKEEEIKAVYNKNTEKIIKHSDRINKVVEQLENYLETLNMKAI